MKTVLSYSAWLLGLLLNFSSVAQTPKLVVSLVVDQMRADYLTRWTPLFEGGFKTLATEGEVFYNAHYTYAPTYTGPGHASIYTGTDPRYHGIIANDWYLPETGRFMYCVEDADVWPVGTTSEKAKRSPKNIRTTTWTDELELASDMKSKIFAFSLKDRGAIPAAGHLGDGAFWLDDKGFVTSSAYMETLPDWLVQFNKQHSPASYMKGNWDYARDRSLYPEHYTQAYERAPRGIASAQFPYDLATVYKAGGTEAFKATPAGNQILVDIALQAVKSENLGRNPSGATDVLAVSFSATDYIGHAMGVRSHATMDMYLRLDAQLGALFKGLDQMVGAENYIVVLTADHGAAQNPRLMEDVMPTRNWYPADLEAELRTLIQAEGVPAEAILNFSNEQLYLDLSLLDDGDDADMWMDAARDALLKHPAIAEAWTLVEIRLSPDPFATMRRNGTDKRGGQVYFALQPGHLSYSDEGTSHGSGYAYDTHVPVIFYGPGFNPKSRHNERIGIKDIAPTLCKILQIAFPSGCTGNPLWVGAGWAD